MKGIKASFNFSRETRVAGRSAQKIPRSATWSNKKCEVAPHATFGKGSKLKK